MRRAHFLMSMVCAVVCLVAWPARGEEVPIPEQAITEDVFAVVWLDAEHFATLPAAMEQVIAALPEDADVLRRGLREKKKEAEVAWRTRIKPMAEAGFRGELQVFRIVPDANDPSKTRVVRSRLARVTAGTTVESFQEAQQKLDYVFYGSPRQYDKQWLDASSVVHADAPTDGTAEQAALVRDLFANTDEAAVRVAFRMTDGAGAHFDELRGLANSIGGPLQFLREPLKLVVDAMRQADEGWLTLQLGDAPSLDLSLRFADEAGAAQMNEDWVALLDDVRRNIKGMAGQLPELEPAEVDALVAQFALERDGRMLHLHLDEQVITHAANVVAPIVRAIEIATAGGAGAPATQPATQAGE